IALRDDEGSGWCKGMRAWVLLLRGEVMEAGVLAEELERHLTIEHPEYLLNAGFALELMRILRAYVEVARGNLTSAETIARGTLGTDGSRFANMAWVQAIGRYPLFVAALLRCDTAAARAHVEGALARAVGRDPARPRRRRRSRGDGRRRRRGVGRGIDRARPRPPDPGRGAGHRRQGRRRRSHDPRRAVPARRGRLGRGEDQGAGGPGEDARRAAAARRGGRGARPGAHSLGRAAGRDRSVGPRIKPVGLKAFWLCRSSSR